MHRLAFAISLLTILLAVSNAVAQQSANTSVPSLINYSGTIRASSGSALSSSQTLGVTFAIYNQQEGGIPLWSEVQNVTVTASGRYSVLLGNASSAGLAADLFSPAEQRWLGVKVEGQAEQPRVLLVSVPYAMKAAEADSLAGHSVGEFVTTESLQSAVKQQLQQGSSASPGPTTAVGAATLPPGPSPYINNGTTQQVGANFNIDGSGTAANLNVTSQYLLGGAPFLGASSGGGLFLGLAAGQVNTGASNIFIGTSAGLVNSTGANNMFVGAYSGQSNTSGSQNTFVGGLTGVSNTTGAANAFFGNSAGYKTTSGSYNMFFGVNAGFNNTIGFGNSFVGVQAGLSNVNGNENLFMGSNSGQNSNGNFNAFIGSSAGSGNTTGNNNTLIGTAAGQALTTGNNNTILGSNAGSSANPAGSNNLYLNSPGNTGDNGTIRIGNPANQTTSYMAGIYGNAPSGALPVVVNAGGQLGTTTAGIGVTSFNGRTGAVVPAANDYSFSLLSGTLGSTQFSGTYSNAVTLSNISNVFYGNGSNLTGVVAGAGSPYYIQNGTSRQTGANFNISGNGTLGGALTAVAVYTDLLVGTGGAIGLAVSNGLFEMQYAVDTINSITSVNMIGGYSGNTVAGGVTGATIGGGGSGGLVNNVTATFGTVSGGAGNTASGLYSIVGGGGSNTASSGNYGFSTVGGGGNNTASGAGSTVGGGYGNSASGGNLGYSTVCGGESNTASGRYSIVGGGISNTASGRVSAVLGGNSNTASGDYSVALGNMATAQYPGSFVWGDSSSFSVADNGPNEFLARSTGGAAFITAINPTTGAVTAGVYVPAGSGSWTSLSDRASKDDFAAVDGEQLLARLDEIPLMTWHYKTQAPEIRHMGPVAQDFRAAFGLGEDDKHIATVDADGVALAAIQALHRQVQQLQQERDKLQQQNEEFQRRLSRLESMVERQTQTAVNLQRQ